MEKAARKAEKDDKNHYSMEKAARKAEKDAKNHYSMEMAARKAEKDAKKRNKNVDKKPGQLSAARLAAYRYRDTPAPYTLDKPHLLPSTHTHEGALIPK